MVYLRFLVIQNPASTAIATIMAARTIANSVETSEVSVICLKS